MIGMVVMLVVAMMMGVLGGTVNKDVSLVIDASASIIRYTAQVKTQAITNKEYQVIFPTRWASHLAYLSVTSAGEDLTVHAPVSHKNYTVYAVHVEESSPQIKINAVFTGLLEPYPAEIEQSENQLVRFEGNHYFYSPYPTESQKLVVKLASSAIESFTKLSPYAVRGTSLHYGPYKDIPAFGASPLKVHYTNNFPFAKFSSVVREVEVSHWGSISVEEIYELKHAGAALKGGFSRFDYMIRRGAPNPSFKSLTTLLPNEATNIYYRDQIGNISTSDIRVGSKNKQLEMEVNTRFPLFGGWQTQFYLGYSIPTELALSVDSTGKYHLKVDYNTQFQNVWVEDMELKVILPEGCSDIQVNVPYPSQLSRAVRYSYLDSTLNGGRTVLIIKTNNLVEEHNKKVEITYSFPHNRMYVEPMMLVASFFAFFVLASLLARTTSAIRPTDSISEKKHD